MAERNGKRERATAPAPFTEHCTVLDELTPHVPLREGRDVGSSSFIIVLVELAMQYGTTCGFTASVANERTNDMSARRKETIKHFHAEPILRRWPVTPFLLLVFLAGPAVGAEFYVDCRVPKSGNGASTQSAFRTIGEAAAQMRAGDTCYIRGGTYRETVVPANSGTLGRPMVFTHYDGEAVTVSGADEIDGGWTVYRDNIYRKTITLPVTGYNNSITGNTALLANQVFASGKMMIEARWPNVDNSDDLLNRNDFRPVTAGAWISGNGTTLQDSAIPDIPGGWTGGVIWFIGWFIPQTSGISASSPGQVQFPTKAGDEFHDYYYLTGRLGALDTEKEWFYDGNALYLWAPGGGVPANVEVKKRNYAFDLRGKSYITVSNISVFAASITTDERSESIVLDRLRVQYNSHFVTLPDRDVINSHSRETGVRLMGPDNAIRNSIVEYSAGHGIVLGGEGCIAENNLVHDISYGGTYCCGILPAPGDARNTITHNTIHRTGRSGIDIVYRNKDIGYNDIYDFGYLNTDTAAIYSARSMELTGTRIHHNWLHDAKTDVGHKFPVGAGIYLDQNTKPTQIDHNVCWNNHRNDIRVEQESAPFHQIHNNTLASTEPGFWLSFHSYPAGNPAKNMNNIYRFAIKPDTGDNTEIRAETDPLFLGEGERGLRFRLQAGSPAIDCGVLVAGITDDVTDGKPDAGAYEYGSDWRAGVISEPGPINTKD